MKLIIELPAIYCPGCRHQLVNYLFVVVATDQLVCMFCAKDRGPEVAPLRPGYEALVPGCGEALPDEDSLALLFRHGAVAA